MQRRKIKLKLRESTSTLFTVSTGFESAVKQSKNNLVFVIQTLRCSLALAASTCQVAPKIYTPNLPTFGVWVALISDPIRGISLDILTSKI